MFLLAMTLTAGLSAAPVQDTKAEAFVLHAEHVHTGTGQVLSPGTVLVRDGKIVEVGAEVASDSQLTVIKLKGHLSAGMVALGDQTLLGEEGADTTRFVLGQAETRFGFDPRQPAMKRLASEGVTTVVLTPPSHSLVAGRGLIAKTGTGRMLAKGQAMHVAFDSGMFIDRADPSDDTVGGGFFFFFGPNGAVNPNGFKSSYSGAAEVLEENVQDEKSPVSMIAGGGVSAWLRSYNRAESMRAIEFAKRHKVKGTLEAGPRVGELAPHIKEAGLGVALTMFRETNSHFATQSALALAKAKVPFGFCLGVKDRPVASLRMAAALCRRAGMSAQDSWSALTSGAAQAVGLQGQVGTVAKGCDADLVLWSGQPGELTSRVVQVWVDGQSVAKH